MPTRSSVCGSADRLSRRAARSEARLFRLFETCRRVPPFQFNGSLSAYNHPLLPSTYDFVKMPGPAIIAQMPVQADASLKHTARSMRPANPDGSPLYPDYMPFYDPLEKVEDIGLFEHNDPGHRADPAKPNLLRTATKIIDIAPAVGTEIHGVQLSDLDSKGLDELALMAAERGALVFRDQKFIDLGFEKQKEIVSYFGP